MSTNIEMTTLKCDGDDTWIHGNSIINYMKWVIYAYFPFLFIEMPIHKKKKTFIK